ncbi:unnamed protein product [marine sediment metagenome]|uniref:Uncharacterized protein n=1 Tax=marine sediment metagenome TaxID=412755 RepID=X1VZ59_9ZZZZ
MIQFDIDVNAYLEKVFTPVVIGLLIIILIGLPLLKKVTNWLF